LRFANAVHQQLLANKQTSYLTELNNYTVFPKAEHIVVFTSTHGLGDAPSNAIRFTSLVPQYPQKETVQVSVVGFGSKAYPDFCGYAKEVETLLSNQKWAQPSLPLYTVNDKSPDEFVAWIKSWSSKIQLPLATTPAVYSSVPADIQKMTLLDKTTVTDNDKTFILTLRPGLFTRFTSGDLLAIYPEGKERLYSIGKSKGMIQLVVKLHSEGIGSGYLYGLTAGSVIGARIIRNASFHFPVKAPTVVMIANGTGIAPFLGMIEHNKKQVACHLYLGFRHQTEVTRHYRKWAEEQIQKKHLKNYQVAYSREVNPGYVMDLIRKDAAFFANVLEQNGVIMICGSLAMQQDVETALDVLCRERNGNAIVYYKSRGQVLTDCY
jgi:sulfite reductase (NADPH) flavoprotein alpha-component